MFLFLHKKPGRPSNLTAAIFISAEDETIFCRPIKKSINTKENNDQCKYKLLLNFEFFFIGFRKNGLLTL